MVRRRYKTVVICGSMRFYDQMVDAAQELSLMGYVVLMPFVRFSGEEQQLSEAKKMLDDMHYQKIDMAHHVVVVTDKSQYIGESTGNEIQYAQSKGKEAYIWQSNHDIRPMFPQSAKVKP